MKITSVKAAIKNGETSSFHFDFSFCPAEDSASIKAWEEENTEYTSWNLIVDQDNPATC